MFRIFYFFYVGFKIFRGMRTYLLLFFYYYIYDIGLYWNRIFINIYASYCIKYLNYTEISGFFVAIEVKCPCLPYV